MLLLKGLRLLNNFYIPNSYRGRSYYLGFGEKGSLPCLLRNPIPVGPSIGLKTIAIEYA